jgi:hypothetical protein
MREAAMDELKDLQKDLKKPLEVNNQPSQPNSSGDPQPSQPATPGLNPASNNENTILPSPPPSSASSDDEVKNA